MSTETVPLDRRALNVFNEDRACPKCGLKRAEAYYLYTHKIMKRVCEMCKYKWYELPLDHANPVPEYDVRPPPLPPPPPLSGR